MPALITHYLHGHAVLSACDVIDGAAMGPTERAAFAFGCQGPDPLFWAGLHPRGKQCARLGTVMHDGEVAAAFDAALDAVGQLSGPAALVGTAFVNGLLAHYMLDRTAHPFIYAMQDEIISAEADLAPHAHEVHAIIESEIDCGMLQRTLGVTCDAFRPVTCVGPNATAAHVASAIIANVARNVWGIPLHRGDYASALGLMRLCYSTIEPAGSRISGAFVRLEKTMRPQSILSALAHPAHLGMRGNASMNWEGRTWGRPGKDLPGLDAPYSDEDFGAVFDRAVAAYPQAFGALWGGTFADWAGDVDYLGDYRKGAADVR